MSDPVVLTVTLTPLEGRAPEVLATLQEAVPKVHEEAGCLLYSVHENPDGTIFMIEKWESQEHLEAHTAGPAIAALSAAQTPLLAEPLAVSVLRPVPMGDPQRGAL